MLCIIFTKRKLLAGIKTDKAQLLDIKGRGHFNYEPSSPHEVLATHLDAIGQAYKDQAKKDGRKLAGAIPTAVAFPVDMKNEEDKKKIINTINNSKSLDLEYIHGDNIVVSFMHGLPNSNKITAKNVMVLESMDDYTHLCYQNIDKHAPEPNLKELGKAALFKDESFEFHPYKDFGTLSGNDRVLTELMAECSVAGLTVDFKGQAQLARQLEEPNPTHTYVVSKTTDSVQLEAEVSLKPEKFEELLLVNKDKLAEKFSSKELESNKVGNILLIGSFLRTQAFKNYINNDLKISHKVIGLDLENSKDEFSIILNGLANRTEQVMEAERIRLAEEERKRLEAEKRAKIAAELKVKEDRDALLQEISKTCVDPSRQADYEKMFKERGASLGIPEMVISWNITEVLSKIELQKEGEGVGLYTTPTKADTSYTPEPAEDLSIYDLDPKEEPVIEKKIEKVEEKVEHELSNYSDEELLASLDEVLAQDEEERTSLSSEEISNMSDIEVGSDLDLSMDELSSVENEIAAEAKVQDIPAKVDVLDTDISADLTKDEVIPEIDKSIVEKPISEDMFTLEMEKMDDLDKLPEELTQEPLSSNGNHASVGNTQPEAVQVKEKIEEKVEEQLEVKEEVAENIAPVKKSLDASISLSDLFSIKGTLPDAEFSTKKVMMVGDQELKSVRVLAAADLEDSDKVARFKKLHKKELSYYQDMSEITEAKEGLFYFRPYIERNSLKSYVKKSGLDNKMDIDELSSTDLKFILQVFKEIRELPTGHADLSEDNILVISKRKWNLQKNMEIKVVGFTSEDATAEQMLERTHEVFAGLLGDAFYQDFREKFQL
ncbi:MAG: hypothetical protein AAFR87_10125 [Bacteroidota bacterium]